MVHRRRTTNRRLTLHGRTMFGSLAHPGICILLDVLVHFPLYVIHTLWTFCIYSCMYVCKALKPDGRIAPFFASFSRPVRSIATRTKGLSRDGECQCESYFKWNIGPGTGGDGGAGRSRAGTQAFLPSRFLMRPPESDVGECAGC